MERAPEVIDPWAGPKKVKKEKKPPRRPSVDMQVETEKEMKDLAVQTVEMARVRPLSRTKRWVRTRSWLSTGLRRASAEWQHAPAVHD